MVHQGPYDGGDNVGAGSDAFGKDLIRPLCFQQGNDAVFQFAEVAAKTPVNNLSQRYFAFSEEGAVNQFHALIVSDDRGPYAFLCQFHTGKLDRSRFTAP
jgi:hypothetical protein